jgi:hypothetical protein
VSTLLDALARVEAEHGLRYEIRGRAVHGQSDEGAWFAVDAADGRPVVLKAYPDQGAVLRFEMLVRSLEVLLERGYPVPVYGPVVVVPGVTLVVQSVLPGITGHRIGPRLVQRVLELNELQVDVPAPVNPLSWGAFVVHSLVEGENGWAMHEPLRSHSSSTRQLLGRIEGIGHQTESHRFHADGVVHLDLHGGNMLLDGDDSLVGVVDWDGACFGDRRFDLVSFAHHLTTTGSAGLAEPVWALLEAVVDPHVLRAYVAHMVLRLVDWQIRHDPHDVPNQLAVGEELLARFG